MGGTKSGNNDVAWEGGIGIIHAWASTWLSDRMQQGNSVLGKSSVSQMATICIRIGMSHSDRRIGFLSLFMIGHLVNQICAEDMM